MTKSGNRLIIAGVLAVAALTGAVGVSGSGQDLADGVRMMDSLSELPAGLGVLPQVKAPADNAQTPQKIELGRRLFFDQRLSGDQSSSCATCHDPTHAFSDGRPRGVGFHGIELTRRTPSVVNSAYNTFQFWDGRAASLEEQVAGPITSAKEMHMTNEAVMVERLNADSEMSAMFQAVFGDEPSLKNVAKAIAAYERTIVSATARFDRYASGDKKALSFKEKRGLVLFVGKARCARCHSGPTFTDNKFHNLGILSDDLGRFAVTKLEADRGAFKTPGLRNVAAHAPYMHDGNLPTLMSVIDYYDRGGDPGPNKSALIMKIGLSKSEKNDLLSFLRVLGDR